LPSFQRIIETTFSGLNNSCPLLLGIHWLIDSCSESMEAQG
jgi:hypothetical protein